MIYGLGMLELGMTFDYAQLLIDNEIARMVKKSVGGINVNSEELAVNVIEQVGAGGEFVSNEHTYRHFREQSQNRLIDRKMRDSWLADGAKDMTERAYDEAKHILENYKPDPLVSGAAETMRIIVEEAEKEYWS